MTDDELEPFFASDLAAEVRREFDLRAVEHGVPVPEATRDVLATFRDLLVDPNAGPVVFITLAALQYKAGRLMPFIRDAALDLIQTGEAKRAFPADNLETTLSRKKLLAAFEAALQEADSVEG